MITGIGEGHVPVTSASRAAAAISQDRRINFQRDPEAPAGSDAARVGIGGIQLRLAWMLVLVPMIAIALLSACSTANQQDADLQQAEATARYITSPRHLRQSMYVSVHEEDTPSELLSYLFSSLGAAEWPYTTDASEMEKEQARSIGMPLQPANVAIVLMAVDARAGKQIVLRPDDGKGLIVADAYLAPDQAPVFTSSWPMPKFRDRD